MGEHAHCPIYLFGFNIIPGGIKSATMDLLGMESCCPKQADCFKVNNQN